MVLGDERASQSVEFTLVLPLLLAAAALLFQVAVFGSEYLAAQSLAGEAARTSAISGPQAAHGALAAVSRTAVQLEITTVRPATDNAEWFNVELRMPSRVFRRLGIQLEVVGRAQARAQ